MRMGPPSVVGVPTLPSTQPQSRGFEKHKQSRKPCGKKKNIGRWRGFFGDMTMDDGPDVPGAAPFGGQSGLYLQGRLRISRGGLGASAVLYRLP